MVEILIFQAREPTGCCNIDIWNEVTQGRTDMSIKGGHMDMASNCMCPEELLPQHNVMQWITLQRHRADTQTGSSIRTSGQSRAQVSKTFWDETFVELKAALCQGSDTTLWL